MKNVLLLIIITFSLAVSAKENTQTNDYKLIVTESGFEPASLKVKSNTAVNLKITRKTDSTCARTLVIPSKNIKVELPLNKEVTVNVGTLTKGEVKFGCAMNMMVNAVLIVE
jgi:plastocyanin domain-containing protein